MARKPPLPDPPRYDGPEFERYLKRRREYRSGDNLMLNGVVIAAVLFGALVFILMLKWSGLL